MSLLALLKRSIREQPVEWLTLTISPLLSALLALGWPNFLSGLAGAILTTTTPIQLVSLLSISVLANLAFLVLLISSYRRESITPKFGVLWDKKGNSYCPSCKKLTSQIRFVSYQHNHQCTSWHGLYCPHCDTPFLLMNNSEPIHAQDAMREMQKT